MAYGFVEFYPSICCVSFSHAAKHIHVHFLIVRLKIGLESTCTVGDNSHIPWYVYQSLELLHIFVV